MPDLLRRILADAHSKARPSSPAGWTVVHEDRARDMYTLERTRRWFKGRYVIVTRMQLLRGWPES